MQNRTHPDTELLDRLRAGLLDESGAECAALEEHLAGCPQCRASLDSWRQLGPDALGPDLDTRAVSTGLRRARLHAMSTVEQRHAGAYSALAAAAMLLLAITAVLWTWQPGLDGAPQMTAHNGDAIPDLYEDLDFYLWMADQHEKNHEENGNANRTWMMKALPIPVTVLLFALASAAGAAGSGSTEIARIPGGDYLIARQEGIPWSALSAEEQRLLARHRASWSSYTPQEQAKLRRGVQRYLELSPEKRNAVNQKQQQFKDMSPEQRERLREKYRRQQRHPDS